MKKINENASVRIKEKAIELGFLDCGISATRFLAEEKDRLVKWLQDGMNGEMEYMANHLEKRLDPGLLVENARSVVSVLLNYFPSDKQIDPDAPVLSKYAYGTDYHFVMKDKLGELLQFIQSEIAPCEGRCFCRFGTGFGSRLGCSCRFGLDWQKYELDFYGTWKFLFYR